MATARLPRLKTVFGRASATLALIWLAGCTGSPAPAPAATTALPPPAAPTESRSARAPVVYKGKPDLEAFVASLRAIGIEPVTTKGIELRTGTVGSDLNGTRLRRNPLLPSDLRLRLGGRSKSYADM
jgi:hypothetical protein